MMYLKDSVFRSTLLDPFCIHGFGTRFVGDGRSNENTQLFLRTQSPGNTPIIKPQQTHSINISHIEQVNFIDKMMSIPDTDGVITRTSNVFLTCITADCVPIIYVDPYTRVIAISHQGWKGTTAHMPTNMIRKMIEVGASAKNIRCAFGPAINICCYHMNLYSLNRDALIESGVLAEHIDIFPFCTSCDERFYSYRREGQIHGELLHFVMLS